MDETWGASAERLLIGAPPDWSGLWALIDAAGHGALWLSLAVRLGSGVDMAFAGLDLGEAREELEWVHPELTSFAPSRLGPLSEDLNAARDAVGLLVTAAVERAHALGDERATPAELEALGRTARKLEAAAREFTRAVL